MGSTPLIGTKCWSVISHGDDGPYCHYCRGSAIPRAAGTSAGHWTWPPSYDVMRAGPAQGSNHSWVSGTSQDGRQPHPTPPHSMSIPKDQAAGGSCRPALPSQAVAEQSSGQASNGQHDSTSHTLRDLLLTRPVPQLQSALALQLRQKSQNPLGTTSPNFGCQTPPRGAGGSRVGHLEARHQVPQGPAGKEWQVETHPLYRLCGCSPAARVNQVP